MAAAREQPQADEPMEEADEEEANADLGAFQREYEDDHSWEALQEDEFGRLRPLVPGPLRAGDAESWSHEAQDQKEEQRAKRRRLLSAAASARIRRGMIRYLQVVVDLSRAAAISDMRPNRLAVIGSILQAFIREFFDQNPLSHLGLIVLRNGVAEKLTDLSGSPEAHIAKLRASLDCGGDASLMNALEAATDALKSIPPYGHREVLIVFAALSTCDPGNVLDAVKAAKQHRVRASVVGIAAEVHICRVLTQETGGTYGVALNEKHLEELVSEHAPPPPARAADAAASLVRMGFPQRNAEGFAGAAFVGADCRLSAGGYTCPRCRARVVELPSSCHVCGLTLVSSPHLARSYHHLFPVPPFTEVSADKLARLQGCRSAPTNEPQLWPEVPWRAHCYGCLVDLGAGAAVAKQNPNPNPTKRIPEGDTPPVEGPSEVVVACPECRSVFCFDCEVYIHESLHNCPGCESRGGGGGGSGEVTDTDGGEARNELADGRTSMDAG